MTHTKTNIIQSNEYYPFGLQTSRSWTRENNKNNFLYNEGSELNTSSGWYETFFRGYDPALGRFMQIDPLATASASWSSYHYGKNDPVNFNDPQGDRDRPTRDERNPVWVEGGAMSPGYGYPGYSGPSPSDWVSQVQSLASGSMNYESFIQWSLAENGTKSG